VNLARQVIYYVSNGTVQHIIDGPRHGPHLVLDVGRMPVAIYSS